MPLRALRPLGQPAPLRLRIRGWNKCYRQEGDPWPAEIPGELKIECSDLSRCTASVTECEDGKRLRFSTKGLRLPDRVWRRRDSSGVWRTRLNFRSEQYDYDATGSYGADEATLEFADGSRDAYARVETRVRAFPRGALKRQRRGGTLYDSDGAEAFKRLAEQVAIVHGYGRGHESVTQEEVEASLPIRPGGERTLRGARRAGPPAPRWAARSPRARSC